MRALLDRWLALRAIRPTRLSTDEIAEQFDLAQALTFHFDRALYDELQSHRRACLEKLRDSTLSEAMPRVFSGSKYNIMSPIRVARRAMWYQIELTPDIMFTVSPELVGRVLPSNYTKRLKDLIKRQQKLLAKEIP